MKKKSIIKIDWLLHKELAIGPAPWTIEDINELKANGISAILSLCSLEELNKELKLEDYFKCKRIVLPDHKYRKPPSINQLNMALEALEALQLFGPVYVHCLAGIERSPLVCMAWLVKKHNLNPTQALDYLMNNHPGTNPLAEQLKLLSSF